MAKAPNITIEFGEGVAIVRRETHSNPIVARVLGREEADGCERVFLDRLVHRQGAICSDWVLSGAVSTVLTRQIAST